MWLAAADTTPQVPWWTLLAAALGSGLVVGLLSFIGSWRQRVHDRQMRAQEYTRQREARAADHEHDLAVRREEDQRRRRDVRLQSLAEGLASMVSAALDRETGGVHRSES